MTVEFDERGRALAAASAAAVATAELLRFTREGEHSPSFAFEEETLAHLADALRMAGQIEARRLDANAEEFGAAPQYGEALGQLQGAVERFLEAWGE